MHRLVQVGLVSASFAAAAPLFASSEIMPPASSAKPGLFEVKPGVIAMAPIPNDEEAPATVNGDDTTSELARGKGASARECLATAIYFEARGESVKGQRAVGEVILARTRQAGRPKTVCGVVYEGSHRSTGCQFSFTCDGIADVVRNSAAWARAVRVAGLVLNSRRKVSRGATHYHATSVRPYWASSLRKVARIGSHIFYR